MRDLVKRALAVAAGLACAAAPAAAQQRGTLSGRVIARDTGEPLLAVVEVLDEDRRVETDEQGRFRIAGLQPGRVELEARALGYRAAGVRLELEAGGAASVTLGLAPQPIETAGIVVSVLRPDLQPESRLEQEEVRAANPRDPGEVLRELPGIDAVRRGPLGLDPAVRGLREAQVGSYIDGERRFPAGPARMDSPLTHVDPLAFRSLEVVKGPYALTWGAGNLSAIRIDTQPLPPEREGPLHGHLAGGYDSNLDAVETSASLFGSRDRVSWWAFGAWREGDDYEDGDGVTVPADFRSAEGRAKLALELAPGSRLTVGGGYQDQGPIDYPGRLLTAELFQTANGQVRWQLERPGAALRAVDVMAYFSDTDHRMNNDGKPTAVPMPGRTPSFALDIAVDTETEVGGGRAAARLRPGGGWELEAGGDVYVANRDAVRTIRRTEDGLLLFEDLVWPDVTVTDGGAFLRADRSVGSRVRISGAVRVDLVEARADTASEFFLENVSTDLEATETNLSGALTVGIEADRHWTISAGLGTAVRTADALERYSDRFPASKAQTSAEFVGDPQLEPERSVQADLWIEGAWERVSVQLSGFVRTIADYITLIPTDLPKRLPLSPVTTGPDGEPVFVFRYANGDATFRGFEAAAALGLTDEWVLKLSTDYLWGEDDTLGEPVLGVQPWRGHAALRWEDPGDRFFGEAALHVIADQDRVATQRGEGPTDGYSTLDLQSGVRLAGGLRLRIGAENLFDERYANHLNARNPFTGERVPEPGRVLYADVGLSF